MKRCFALFVAFLGFTTACTQLTPNDSLTSGGTSSEGEFAFFGREAVEAYKFQEIKDGLSDVDVSNDNFLRMVQSVGGYSKFDEFTSTANPKEMKRLHSKFGIGFLDSVPEPAQLLNDNQVNPQAITDCNRTFSSAERGLSYRYNGHYMHIDSVGRPHYSNTIWVTSNSAVLAAPRNT